MKWINVITVLDNIYDSIIWVKINQHNGNKCTAIAFCYIPPENSVFYDFCDVDLYDCLEESVAHFKDSYNVYVAGDLNSRTGIRDDFIYNDNLDKSVLNAISPICNYDEGSECCKRSSMDMLVNTFGRKLISLCKTTGLRIVNGRHSQDPNGNITFYNSRGTSLIDYVLADYCLFEKILEFSAGVFNTFSDHSPVAFCLQCITPSSSPGFDNNITAGRTFCTSVKWIEGNTQNIRNTLLESSDRLSRTIDIEFKDMEDVNVCIENFCCIINECVLPFAEVKDVKHKTKNANSHPKSTVDKPWFNSTCKTLYNKYKECLFNFNKNMSAECRKLLVEAKQKYKKVENRLKRQYKRQEGDMLEYLRKNNPKYFYNIFCRKKIQVNKTDLNIDDFVRHFRNLMESADTMSPNDGHDFDDHIYESTFDELDEEISREEITRQLKN